jgi:hypothetical protein
VNCPRKWRNSDGLTGITLVASLCLEGTYKASDPSKCLKQCLISTVRSRFRQFPFGSMAPFSLDRLNDLVSPQPRKAPGSRSVSPGRRGEARDKPGTCLQNSEIGCWAPDCGTNTANGCRRS